MPISKIDTAALAITDLAYTGTLTGGAGVVNLGSGQVYKDASGNLGVGTTTPLEKLDVRNNNVSFGTGTATAANVYIQSGYDSSIKYVSRITADYYGSISIASATPATSAAPSTGSYTTRLNINVNGAIGLTGALTSASGVGITFPATQASSSNANTLDDYEEGTWTPSFIVTYGSSTWGSYLQQTGSYVKIGRLVYCMFNIGVPSLVNGGNIGLSGLPFQVDANAGATCGGAREGAQTGAWYQAESVNNNQIGVLRRYDNGGFPNGSVNMSGFVTYIASV